MGIKFDNSSCSHLRNMIGVTKFKVGHVTLNVPPLGLFVISRLGLLLLSIEQSNLKSLYLHQLCRK